MATNKPIKKEELIKQRQEKIAAAREALIIGIKALESDEDWKLFLNKLTKRGRFSPSRLSFGNQMLVYIQFPSAVAITTFRSWFKIGRWPVKGSKGIMIFQPRPYMKKSKDEPEEGNNGGDDNGNSNTKYVKTSGKVYFKPIYVFDITQTEGRDPPAWLAPPEPPKIENKEVFKDNVEKLAELAEKMPGNPVSKVEIRSRKQGDHPVALGAYYKDTKIIVVIKTDNRGEMFKTLVHEVAHAIMHGENDRPAQVEEVEAESVAYVVNKTLGLDTSDYSFKYVASWAGTKETKTEEAIKLIERTGQRIVATANMILDTLMPIVELPDEDEKTGSPDTPEPIKEGKVVITPQPIPVETIQHQKRKLGRPKGSKNKPKEINEPVASQDDIDLLKSIGFVSSSKYGGCYIKEYNNGTYTVFLPGDTRSNKYEMSYQVDSEYRIDFKPSSVSGIKKQIKEHQSGKISEPTPSIPTEPSCDEPSKEDKIIAISFERYNGGVKIKKLYGSSTITKFYVYEQKNEVNVSKWKIIEGYGKTPGDRKTFAIQRFLEQSKINASEPEPVIAKEPATSKRINQKDYKFYVALDNKIIAGNEYKEDAKEFIKGNIPYVMQTNCKVYSKKFLIQNKIDPDINENWSNLPLSQVDETSHYRSEEPKSECSESASLPQQFVEKKQSIKPQQAQESTSRKPRSNAYSLKPGMAFKIINDSWEEEMVTDEAVSTAKPIGRAIINDSECIVFKDAQLNRWAQITIIAKNRGNKRALKKHMKQAEECTCIGKTSKKANKTESDFDKKSIATGVKVELEHTDDIDVAKKIAMDHLTEDPEYYVKLIKAGL